MKVPNGSRDVLGRGLCFAIAIASASLALVAVPSADATIFRFGIQPQEGGHYPIGTWLKGICEPEAPVDQPHTTRTHIFSEFFRGDEREARVEPESGPAPGQTYGGECTADITTPTLTEKEHLLESGDSFQVIDAGSWSMQVWSETREYEQSPPPEGDGSWVDLGGELFPGELRTFEVFSPCHAMVRSVTGKVFVVKGGKRRPVRKNQQIEVGETLVVERGGKTTIEGNGGDAITFQSGKYAFSDSKECEAFFGRADVTAEVPPNPVPVKVNQGTLEVLATAVERAVQAAGVNYRAVSPRAAQRRPLGTGQFSRLRIEREGRQTTACALAGSAVVTSTRPSVPESKRELTLVKGQCAVVADGKAPKRLRR